MLEFADMQTHESFDREHETTASSERGFGLVFAAACAIVALVHAWHGKGPVAVAWLSVAALFVVFALFWNAPLAPFNRLWSALGELLHSIANPLLMGLIFVFAVVPVGLVLRLAGKDMLRLRRDPAARTYWIDRDPASARHDAMKDQF